MCLYIVVLKYVSSNLRARIYSTCVNSTYTIKPDIDKYLKFIKTEWGTCRYAGFLFSVYNSSCIPTTTISKHIYTVNFKALNQNSKSVIHQKRWQNNTAFQLLQIYSVYRSVSNVKLSCADSNANKSLF